MNLPTAAALRSGQEMSNMPSSDTPHDAPATTLTEEQLAEIERHLRSLDKRNYAAQLSTDANLLLFEVRAQRRRIAAQDRVVEAASRVVYGVMSHPLARDKYEIDSAIADALRQAVQALAALEEVTHGTAQ